MDRGLTASRNKIQYRGGNKIQSVNKASQMSEMQIKITGSCEEAENCKP